MTAARPRVRCTRCNGVGCFLCLADGPAPGSLPVTPENWSTMTSAREHTDDAVIIATIDAFSDDGALRVVFEADDEADAGHRRARAAAGAGRGRK